VFCFDEKTQCQALDRPQPSLPMKPGRASTMTHDYRRHVTVDLFAAMNLGSGEILHDVRDTHTGRDVLAFFKWIDRHVPTHRQSPPWQSRPQRRHQNRDAPLGSRPPRHQRRWWMVEDRRQVGDEPEHGDAASRLEEPPTYRRLPKGSMLDPHKSCDPTAATRPPDRHRVAEQPREVPMGGWYREWTFRCGVFY